MDITVFSNSKIIEKFFETIKKAKGYSLSIYPVADFKKIKDRAPGGSLIYLDISSYNDTERKKMLNRLYKLEGYHCGLIDPKNSISDIAGLFHKGISDYIGKELIKTGISAKRFPPVVQLHEVEKPIEKGNDAVKSYIPSGDDWSMVKSGKEYTFTFFFIELDNKQEIKHAGKEHSTLIMKTFENLVQKMMAPIKGQIWMWMDFGGVALVPFNGKKCDAILEGLRVMLNRKMLSGELFDGDIMLSYRVAIHIGNTTYKKRGQTGTLISDTINSVFHLGQKFAEPGEFYLTDDAAAFIPEGMKKCFVSAGEYEGRIISRLKTITNR